ncbi:transmembrane protein 185B [Folsomia candida]|uniref:transmembrane protein 185B n=1 Tax=Folsomia candida TaxID=158441 RepID=UPI000B8F1D6C|nr:transmembrane protein 185B [Folsomia candida]
MNVERISQDCNPSKFLVYSCLFVFTILLALRQDGVITWSYWIIFTPIWVWKTTTVLGAVVGSFIWWRHPHYRIEGEAYIQYKAMIITFALHLLLLLFELLACDNLESQRHFWILVFIPLIFISIISIAICIWAVKNDRSFDLELFCSVNILQFIFLALRLDNFIQWTWEVIFVPSWILLCVSLVGVLYSIIFAGIIFRAPEVSAEQRRNSTSAAIGHTFLVVPVLVFQVLLTNKLDGDINISYMGVISPLCLTFAGLILMSLSNKRSNKWWFGIRKSFCHFLLDICPCFQEYCNISYSVQSQDEENHHRRENNATEPGTSASESQSQKLKTVILASKLNKPVVPIISVETPD